MALASLYRRTLPSPPAVEFSSPQGKQLFVEALEGGNVEGFFKLISYYQTQSEPAYCGLASLAMVLNALAIDPGRKWKGPWRWFDDSMLDCCEPLVKIKAEGISFGKLACLAHCNGAEVQAFRSNESTLDDFRRYVIQCADSEDCHMITSYHRGHFKQTGTGHFSPIGGYHAGRDMVLILDVARFKYPPHWVPLKLLWEAMDTIDDATGHRRGFMMISKPQKASSVLYTVSCRHASWNSIATYLVHDVPLLLKLKEMKDVHEVVSVVVTSLPNDFKEFIKWVAEVRRQDDASATLTEEEKGRLAVKGEVLKQVQETGLFEHVTRWLASESYCKNMSSFSNKDTLGEIADSICCQGAKLLSGKHDCKSAICLKSANLEHVESTSKETLTVLSRTVVSDGTEERVDMLVPSSRRNLSGGVCNSDDDDNCSGMHPSTDDVLTVLLLALPQHTWYGIKEEKLREEMISLIVTENLPTLLQDEVLHLRRQLHFIMTDLVAPSPI
ncbi:hypothetical protein LguiB_030735 [Lonicera macranthoides]